MLQRRTCLFAPHHCVDCGDAASVSSRRYVHGYNADVAEAGREGRQGGRGRKRWAAESCKARRGRERVLKSEGGGKEGGLATFPRARLRPAAAARTPTNAARAFTSKIASHASSVACETGGQGWEEPRTRGWQHRGIGAVRMSTRGRRARSLACRLDPRLARRRHHGFPRRLRRRENTIFTVFIAFLGYNWSKNSFFSDKTAIFC